MSKEEAVRDIAAILERVEHGAAIVVERDERPAGRLLSECVALAEAHGPSVTLDGSPPTPA